MTLACMTALGLWAPSGAATTLPGGLRLVREPGEQRATFTLRRGGAVVASWQSPGYDASGGWWVATMPGAPILVAERLATSNGMAVTSWRFTAVTPGHAPVHWGGADWGLEGVRATRQGLEVMACEWASPVRGPHRASLHFIGAWCRVTAAGPVLAGPWRARRYTYRFERERFATFTAMGGRPAHWLRPGAPGGSAVPTTPGRLWPGSFTLGYPARAAGDLNL